MVRFTASSESGSIVVSAYSTFADGTTIKGIVLCGPEQACKGVFANMNQGSAMLSYNKSHASRCEFRYTRKHVPLPCKYCLMWVQSKDPRVLWNHGPAGLMAGLRRTTETPLLDEWEPFIRKELQANGLLKQLSSPSDQTRRASILLASTEDVDGIVSDGIKRNIITLKGVAA